MTPNEIAAFVNEAVGNAVANQAVVSNLKFIIGIIVMAVSAFAGSYLSKKGANKALKEDLDKLTRIVESIKTAHAKELEDYKRALNKRDQAAKIATVLARRIIGDASDINPQLRQDLIDYQSLIWELSMWLPADLALQLNNSLHGDKLSIEDAKNTIIAARKLLNPNEDCDILKAENITHLHNDITLRNTK